jgi:hypothetical protein
MVTDSGKGPTFLAILTAEDHEALYPPIRHGISPLA